MRAVTGIVASSSRVSLSKAAVILARFADSDTAAPLEVAAYVRRASAAFDELADFYREIKLSRKRAESGAYKEEHSGEKKEKTKKKRKREGEGEDAERRHLGDGIVEREIGVVGNGNLVMEDGGRKKKKRKKEVKEEEMHGFEVKEENNINMEEESKEERKKKKKNKKKEYLDEEGRDRDKKNKNYLDIGIEQGELVDQTEQHKKKKKKKRKNSEAED